jgi:hypothetical protein
MLLSVPVPDADPELWTVNRQEETSAHNDKFVRSTIESIRLDNEVSLNPLRRSYRSLRPR